MRTLALLVVMLCLLAGCGAEKVTSCDEIIRAGDSRSVLLVDRQLSAEGWIYQVNRGDNVARAVLSQNGVYPDPKVAFCRVHIVPVGNHEFDTYVTVKGRITGISYDMVWGGYDIYVDN